MPRENRKRGKKHKKHAEDTEEQVLETQPVVEDPAQPSWIKPARVIEEDPSAPFGYVDADVKAYFRSVDVQIRGWAEVDTIEEEPTEDRDPNEGECT